MNTLDQFNFEGKRAVVRVDFNVPLNDKFEITDDTRIQAAAPTVKKILADGGCAVLMSHLGRPKGVDEKFSLKHIVARVSEVMGTEVLFADNCIGETVVAKAEALKPGQILLVENLRFPLLPLLLLSLDLLQFTCSEKYKDRGLVPLLVAARIFLCARLSVNSIEGSIPH